MWKADKTNTQVTIVDRTLTFLTIAPSDILIWQPKITRITKGYRKKLGKNCSKVKKLHYIKYEVTNHFF